MSEFTDSANRFAVPPETHLFYFALFYRATTTFVGGEKRLASGLH
jgi:hypothetical protein